MGAPSFQPVRAKQALNRVQAAGMPFGWSLNPYRGCTHGCSFCYARAFQTFLGLNADDTFQNHILVKVNAAEALEQQLERLARKHRWNLRALADEIGTVAIGTATDPYQPVEARAQITRECLKVLAAYRVPVSITTRSPLILRDLDILTQMEVRAVHVSAHTVDRRVWRALEPATPAPEKRLDAVRRLTEAGVRAGVFVAPVIPYLTDRAEALQALLEAVRDSGARFAVPSVLRLTPDVKAWFFPTIGREFPHLLPRLRWLYPGAEARPHYIAAFMRRVHAQLAALGLSEEAGDSREACSSMPAALARADNPGGSAEETSRRGEFTVRTRTVKPAAGEAQAGLPQTGPDFTPVIPRRASHRVRIEQLPLPL